MSSMNVSDELTSSNGMWSSILMFTLLFNVMNTVLLSDSAFIEEAYLPMASRKIQIREREKIDHEASASNVSSTRSDRCHSLLSDGIQ